VQKKDSAAGTKSYNPKKETIEVVDEEEEVVEPKKVSASKPKEEPKPTADLSNLVDQWDDE
jgi:hypothetical protein